MIGGEYHEKMIGASLWGNNILNDADGFRNMGEKKSDFETVYKALNASERRRLWRSVIKEIRMDAGKNLDIIFL